MTVQYLIRFLDITTRNRKYSLECKDEHYVELLEFLRLLKTDLNKGLVDISVIYNTIDYYPRSITFLSLILDVLYETMHISESIMYNFGLDITNIYNIFRTIREIYEFIKTNIVIDNKFICRHTLNSIFMYRTEYGTPEPVSENMSFFNSIIDFTGIIMLDIIMTGESPYIPYRNKYVNESVENYRNSFPAVPDIIEMKKIIQEKMQNILDKTDIKYIEYKHILNVINTVQNKYKEYMKNVNEEVDDYLIADLRNIVFGYFS